MHILLRTSSIWRCGERRLADYLTYPWLNLLREGLPVHVIPKHGLEVLGPNIYLQSGSIFDLGPGSTPGSRVKFGADIAGYGGREGIIDVASR